MIKYQSYYYKLVDHKIKPITSFHLIGLHLQKKIILEMFITASTEYCIVKSVQEMDLASDFAMKSMTRILREDLSSRYSTSSAWAQNRYSIKNFK